MLKALLLNYPDDETAWLIEDEYLFGDDILVAPIFEKNANARKVYLPAGKWIDHHARKTYAGTQWINIETADLPGIILVRYGSMIPYARLAQSTAFMDWSNIEFVAFSDGDVDVSCNYYLRQTDELETLTATFANNRWQLNYKEKTFSVRSYKAE